MIGHILLALPLSKRAVVSRSDSRNLYLLHTDEYNNSCMLTSPTVLDSDVESIILYIPITLVKYFFS